MNTALWMACKVHICSSPYSLLSSDRSTTDLLPEKTADIVMAIRPLQHYRVDSGSQDSNESSSRGSRAAYTDLGRSSSSDSDSTEVSTNADKISQRRPCRKGRADLEFRLSATYTRRHSSPGPRPARRTSTSLQSPSDGSKAAIQRRRKCQPHHRCASMNESVSSILKPPKYSPSSSITSESGDRTAKKPSRFLRRWSWSEPSRGSEGQDLPPVSLNLPLLPLPLLERPLNKPQKRPSRDKEDRWVADGVDFCSSVEVHVFRK